MANQEINEKILNKKFKKAVFSGYDSADVDTFFDSVIEYLKNNDKMVELYKKEAEKLKMDIQALKVANNSLEKDNAKLQREIKEFRDEGYGSMRLRPSNQK